MGFSVCSTIPVQGRINLASLLKAEVGIELSQFRELTGQIPQNSSALIHWLSINQNERNTTSWVIFFLDDFILSFHNLYVDSFMFHASSVKETFDCSGRLTLDVPEKFDFGHLFVYRRCYNLISLRIKG